MCGIAGFVGFEDRQLLERMMDLLVHRGPDDFGCYYNEEVALGHRRLSIIDPKGGKEPIFNEDRSLCIVFNGEIYNFRQIRKELEEKGHRFYTKTDTEVVVHAYEEEGVECVRGLNGMFAFAIWDEGRRRLFLARDRLGIKPLYYYIGDGKIIFASETKAILESREVDRSLDLVSLDRFLTLRYVPGPHTLFRSIKRLPPGSILLFEDGRANIRKYWDIPIGDCHDISEKEAPLKFFSIFEDSVRLRLMSDVPLGAFLSGGIDSSSIVGLMHHLGVYPIRTFVVGFGTQDDEVSKAKEIADDFEAEHHQIQMGEDDLSLFSKIVWYLDEPIGDPIIIPIYLLSRLASSKVKVVLTGEGADEILAGYVHHLTLSMGQMVPRGVKMHLLRPLMKFFPLRFLDLLFQYPSSLGLEGKMRLLSYLHSKTEQEDYLSLSSFFTREEKEKLYTQELREQLKSLPSIEDEIRAHFSSNRDFLTQILLYEIRSWLPDNILFKLDRLTMANSMEGRVPFLDHRLVEFAFALPSNMKLRRVTNKYLLRRAMREVLPHKIVSRRKQAFFVPLGGFERGLKNLFEEVFSFKRIKERGYFNSSYIEELWRRRNRSPLIYNKQMMSLLALEVWFTTFVDNSPS
jgi:asparagine synthase (glutamine-hydrolysing)